MKWIKKVAATPLETIAKVVDSLAEATGDRTNAPSIHAVRGGLNDVWQNIYPIGSIYMSVTDVNPSTLFGGTWNRVKDCFLLASGDIYPNGVTGGAEDTSFTPSGTVEGHAITVPELPEHIHGKIEYVPDNDPDFGYYHLATGSTNIPKMLPEAEYDNTLLGVKSNDGSEYAQGLAHDHDFTGDEATINIMPPYLTVNVWTRTA